MDAIKAFLPEFDMRRDMAVPATPEPMDDTQTPAGRRYAMARAHAHRLMAQAHAAMAEAELLNPWAPDSVRKRFAESERTVASQAMDRALEAEAEAAE